MQVSVNVLYPALFAVCTHRKAQDCKSILRTSYRSKVPCVVRGIAKRADLRVTTQITQVKHHDNTLVANNAMSRFAWLTNFNLLDQLTFYGSYHNNKWNQLIHAMFVPTIFWSVIVWFAYTPELISLQFLQEKLAWLPYDLNKGVIINYSALPCLLYCLYYLTLEFFAGLTWGVFVAAPILVSANLFVYHFHSAWLWAIGIHIFSWYMQIHIGHAILEGRKPALLDSFFQSLVLAPLFVWMETLFMLGYRRQLQAQLQARVEANLEAFNASKQPLLAKAKNSDITETQPSQPSK